jgi:hypothetical protein
MKFHLIYSGNLPASGNKSKPDAAREIRDKLSPQLKKLWETHAALKELSASALVPKPHDNIGYGGTPLETSGEVLDRYKRTGLANRLVNLCEPIDCGQFKYVPLVRKSLDLNCSLSILFLRQQDPGELVSQGGDIDNRIKTLLDALRIPHKEVQDKYPPTEETIFCLLESDFLVSGLEIETDRLLSPSTDHSHEVHLVIEVTIHVLRVGMWNICLV